jgi:hypothetical protein
LRPKQAPTKTFDGMHDDTQRDARSEVAEAAKPTNLPRNCRAKLCDCVVGHCAARIAAMCKRALEVD